MDNESHEPEPVGPENPLTPTTRRDGWTPFARRIFLEVLSETGRVSLACEYAGLTKQSAYALRNRDPVFAAGWDAACELARAPLADALYEQAVNGITETITRDGEVVAERHRHDSRLSIAVLHRLDKRCDRAAEQGSSHLVLVRRWDEWLTLVGRGEDQAAQALLETRSTEGQSAQPGTVRNGQLGQLPESANPMIEDRGEDDEPQEIDLSERCWKDEDEKVWMTDFPPPPGFEGYQSCDWNGPDNSYERECTSEEVALLETEAAAIRAVQRSEEEQLRDAWFEALRQSGTSEGSARQR